MNICLMMEQLNQLELKHYNEGQINTERERERERKIKIKKYYFKRNIRELNEVKEI